MEEVAIMISQPLVNNDELSDETESINLDLHVSDTEDSTASSKKGDVENNDHAESEEDILNKYVDDGFNEGAKKLKNSDMERLKPKLVNGMLDKDKYKHCNGTISPLDDLKKVGEEEDLNRTLTNGNDDTLTEDAPHEEDTKEEATVEHHSEDEKVVNETSNSQDDKPEKEVTENEDNVPDDTDSSIEKEATPMNVDSDRTDSDKKTSSDDKMDVNVSEETEKLSEETEKSSEKTEKSCSIDTADVSNKSVVSSSTQEASSSNKSNETKTDNDSNEDDDLLCVMDEKSLEEANENKDENSCSSSEKDDETKESEDNNDEEANGEGNEETTDVAKEDEDAEETNESQTEMDMDSSECAMDIEESDIGGVVYTDESRVTGSDQISISESKIEGDKDANKENENGDVSVTETSVKENGLIDYTRTNGVDENLKEDDAIFEGFDEKEKDKETLKKSSKRQLSDSSTESENTKKIRLETEEEVEKPPEKEKRPIKLLDNFKRFMLDKKLKSLTRFDLEELCIQKMCECIVNKSEIGELRQKIMIQEQTIDTWRKEAVVVAKQTRDLKIVHERLMADLKAMREQTGKPLVPVKITRSVGLQAIIENPPRLRPAPIISGPTTPQRSPVVNQQQNKPVPSPQNRQQQTIKPKTQPQRVNSTVNRPLQPISQKDNVNNAKSRQSLPSPQAKKNTDPKAVIDLTDEDEKNQSAKQTTTTTASPTVRILNKQNVNSTAKATTPTTPNSQASKIMFVSPGVLPRNSAVMVKMNSNGIVTTANGITSIPNGQVSVVTTPVVRTVSQVRVPISSVSTVRAAPSPVKQPIYKHPAPLPAAPSYQNNMAGKKPIPPKPHLNLTRSNCGTGIVLQWKMPYKLDSYETIVSYQLYAYQETKSPPKTDNWGKIGDVKALELPMAVTLTQFAVGNRYFFAVRAVDGQKRLGPFSDPENILL